MTKFKNTYKSFGNISNLIIKELKKQLKLQKHYATGKLSNSFAGTQEQKGQDLILNITSSKDYWRVVNDPKVAFTVNKQNIIRWVNTKGLDRRYAHAIYRRLKQGKYGKPYVYWEEGNRITRTNFAGIVAKENSQKVAEQLAPAIGSDVAEMIRKQINKNTKAKAS